MGRRFIAIIISMVLFFPVHLYATGSVMALWKIVDETPWKAETVEQESPVKARTKDWVEYWVKKPFTVIETVLSPDTEFQEDVRKRTLWATPVIYLIAYWMVFWGGFRKRKFEDASKYGSHGTSRWAKTREIFRKGELVSSPVNERDGAGVILGYAKNSFLDWLFKTYITLPPDSEYNQNFIAYGGSGIGKSYTWVKTQILNTIYSFEPTDGIFTRLKIGVLKALGPIGRKLANLFEIDMLGRRGNAKRRKIPTEYSLVVVDPKGENYEDTAGILEKNGYKVWMINLIDLFLSAHWNPLDYVRDDLEAEQLSITIISNSSLGHRGGGDPFWERAENALLAALILFVKYELPKEQQNLTNVLNIILTIGEDENLLNEMFDSLSFNHPAKMKYSIFRLAEDKTRTGILIGFASHLQLWTNQDVQDLTVQSDFMLGDLGKEKMALFLVIPDADKKFKSITSLFFAQCFQEWWLVARKHNDVLPIGVRLIMDEFANIGYIPDFDMRMSVMRSKGVSAQIILQTRSQLDNLYKDTADIIAAACDTTVFLGTNDDKTAKSMSDTLGDMTIRVQSTSSKPGKIGGDPSNSEQYQARKLMDPAEIKRSSRKINIIVQNGAYPFKVRKAPFTKHPLYKEYEKRNVADYVAPPTQPWDMFDFETYLAESGVFHRLLEKDSGEVEASNPAPQSQSSNSTNVLKRLFKATATAAEEAAAASEPAAPNVNEVAQASTVPNEVIQPEQQPLQVPSPTPEIVPYAEPGTSSGEIQEAPVQAEQHVFEAPIELTVTDLASAIEEDEHPSISENTGDQELETNGDPLSAGDRRDDSPDIHESSETDMNLQGAESEKTVGSDGDEGKSEELKEFEKKKPSILNMVNRI